MFQNRNLLSQCDVITIWHIKFWYLSYHRKEVLIVVCISSSVRPLVSGTIFAMNIKVAKLTPEKMRKDPAVMWQFVSFNY